MLPLGPQPPRTLLGPVQVPRLQGAVPSSNPKFCILQLTVSARQEKGTKSQRPRRSDLRVAAMQE